jgi:hypothetical protein
MSVSGPCYLCIFDAVREFEVDEALVPPMLGDLAAHFRLGLKSLVESVIFPERLDVGHRTGEIQGDFAYSVVYDARK